VVRGHPVWRRKPPAQRLHCRLISVPSAGAIRPEREEGGRKEGEEKAVAGDKGRGGRRHLGRGWGFLARPRWGGAVVEARAPCPCA
jgi:hypothetical protein